MQKRIFLYGFGPFLQWTENITQKIIENMPEQEGLYKQVLPVKFDKKIFQEPLKQYQPDVVIGIGQHARARKIRIEKKAINKKCPPGKKSQAIFAKGPDCYFLNVNFPKDKMATTTYNAGTYVCNFSMYVIANYFYNKEGVSGFLHIPKDMALDQAILYVNKVVAFILEF